MTAASSSRLHALCVLLSVVVTVCWSLQTTRKWPGSVVRHRDRRRTPTTTSLHDSSTKTEQEVRDQMRLDREVVDPTVLSQVTDVVTDLDEEFVKSLTAKRSYLRIVLERFMQSIDDMQLSSRIKESNKEEMKTRQYFTSKLFPDERQTTKEKVVVLGTGWGGHSFVKTIDATKYDVKVISPRNYFMFTPMLAASAVGTVEFRSIIEPIRNVNPFVDYIEATALSLDASRKVVMCQSIKCEGTACDITDFEVPYDHLLVAVGATTNTFGIKGVLEHCLFLKQIEDASNLRKAIAYCFERANLPDLSEEEIRSALSFVVVGAGPTGVEFTSELRDWLETEGRRYYPLLLKYVKITLVEAGKSVLAVFDETLQREALKRLTQRDTQLVGAGLIAKEVTTVLLSAGVKEVGEKLITLSTGELLPYGFCVWAAGNGPIPLVLDVIENIPEQKALQGKARGRIVTDSWLRVAGADGVYSIGDCAMMEESPLPATAQVASQQGAYLGRLFSKGFDMKPNRVAAAVAAAAITAGADAGNGDGDSKAPAAAAAAVAASKVPSLLPPYRAAGDDNDDAVFASEYAGFGRLSYNADNTPIIKKRAADGTVQELEVVYAKPFQFLNLGVLAYVGASKALAQISVGEKNILGYGPLGFLLWRGIYWSKQVSWRNRVLVGLDWVKGRLFGRDIGNL